MRYLRNTYGRPTLFAVLALCVLLGLSNGCSMSEKKEKAEFEPGTEWVEGMRDRIEKNIEDPNKKTDLLALVDQIEKDLVELDRVVQKLYADLRTLNDNYNASPEEYRKVISEFEADRKEVQDRIVNSRFKMRDLSTPEEWKKLVDYSKGKGFYQQTIRQPDK